MNNTIFIYAWFFKLYPSDGVVVFIVIVGILFFLNYVMKDVKRTQTAFEDLQIKGKSKIEFGRYAIKNTMRLEYPLAFIKDEKLVIISKEEAGKTGQTKQKIIIL